MRIVRGRGMEVILTELYENKVSRINEKVSYKVPVPGRYYYLACFSASEFHFHKDS